MATAMVTLSRLGLSTAFIGKAGSDQAGQEIIRGLMEEGVDTSGVVRAEGKSSQIALIVIEEKTAHRTIFWTKGTCFPMAPQEIDENLIRSARLLHLDGLHIEASIEAARYARRDSIPTMLDSGTLRKEIFTLLPLIDYLVVAEGFALKFAGTAEEALPELAKFGARLICVTLGEKGCIALEGKKIYRQRAFPVNAVDTTGCGDVFHGGLIYGILQGWPPAQSIEFASATAALKCRKVGGRAALPALGEVQEFLSHIR